MEKKKHIETIVPKLSAATFAMRVARPFLSFDYLKLIYYSFFFSILIYRIIEIPVESTSKG
jgi:hypothetical protein